MAKTLKRLIDGQSIRIDAHKRCVPNKCDNDIHIHKTQLNTNKGYSIRIPLIGEPQHILEQIKSKKIRKEIKAVLRDEKVKREFLRVYIKLLQRILTGNAILKQKKRLSIIS